MKKNRDIFKAISLFSQFGISMITPVLISVIFFKFIADKLFSSSKLVIILGVIIGAGSSFLTMYKMIKALNKKDE